MRVFRTMLAPVVVLGFFWIHSGCSRALDARIAAVSREAVNPKWQEPVPADLLSLFDLAPSDSCSMDADGPSGSVFIAGQFSGSFSDYRVVRSGERGLLVAGVGLSSSGNQHRVLAQIYSPGSGTDSLPVANRLLDEAPLASHYRDLFLAASSAGEFLAGAFQPLGSIRGAGWSETFGWELTAQTTAGDDHRNSAAVPSTILGGLDFGYDLSNGWNTSVGTSTAGWSLAIYPTPSASTLQVRGYTAADSWDTSNPLFTRALSMGPAAASGSVRQALAISDGLGVTVLWSQHLSDGAVNCFEVRSSWFTEAPGGATWNTSATDPQSLNCSAATASPSTLGCTNTTCEIAMNAAIGGDFATTGGHSPISGAADGNGTVVALFYGTDPTFPSITACAATGCKIRLFASVRGADGVWFGPTQVDENLLTRRTTTTYFQAPLDTATPANAVNGGVMLPSPGIAYLGSGSFLLVYAVNDLTTSGSFKTRIFARKYQVGSGWSPSSEVQELTSSYLQFDASFTSAATTLFRRVQDLSVTSDEAGNALLTVSLVVPRDGLFGDLTQAVFSLAQNRAVQPAHAFYRAGAWEEFETFGDWVPCPLTATNASTVPTGCNSVRYQSLLFPSGHALLFVPEPVSITVNSLRLKVSEYIPEGAAP